MEVPHEFSGEEPLSPSISEATNHYNVLRNKYTMVYTLPSHWTPWQRATVRLDEAWTGGDAGLIADEVIAHLSGLVSSDVRLTLEIEADIPAPRSTSYEL